MGARQLINFGFAILLLNSLRSFCRCFVCVTLALCVEATVPVRAQSDEIASLEAKSNELSRSEKYSEAIPFAQRALDIREKTQGSDHPNVAVALNNLAILYRKLRQYAAAEPLYKRALAIQERASGPDSAKIAVPLNNLANVYKDQGRYADAEPLYKRALTIWEKTLGPEHSNALVAANNLADVYRYQHRYADAEPLYKRVLAVRERTLAPDHLDIAVSLSDLAQLYEGQGRYSDAEPLYKRSLEIEEKKFGLDHASVLRAVTNLANLYQKEGRFDAAEPMYKRSLATWEKTLGPADPLVALALSNLANVYKNQGRYTEAEPLYKRSLAIREKVLNENHPDVASALNNLANLYRIQGRYSEAEALYQRSLTIKEKRFGSDDPIVALALNNLGNARVDQGHYADAEPLFKRALTIEERVLGPDHPDVALVLNNLADLYWRQGSRPETEQLYRRSLGIQEKTLGAEHLAVADTLGRLAALYWTELRPVEALLFFSRELTIQEKMLGPDHPTVAHTLNNMAAIYRDQRRFTEAEPLFKRSLAIQAGTLGPDNPSIATTQNNLVELYQNQERYADGVALAQDLVARGRARPSTILPFLFGAQSQLALSPEKAADDALNVSQRAIQTLTAVAVGKLAVRLAAGNDRLAQLVRRHQDLSDEAEKLDVAIVAAVAREPAKRDVTAERQMRDRLSGVLSERAALQEIFEVDFPDFAALSNPTPLTIAHIQQLLSDEEALVLFASGSPGTTYVFALTRDRYDWAAIPFGNEVLSKKVSIFRRGLEVDQVAAAGNFGSFDLRFANELYLSLFGPIDALIKNKKQLLVVPTGALSALPFNLLVTEKAPESLPSKLSGYRNAAWLIKRQAVAVVPSVASLKALRTFGNRSSNTKSLVGFGNPVFNPNAASLPGPRASARSSARNLPMPAYTDYWRGAQIDRDKLAQSLPELPDTAIELQSIAAKLNVSSSDLYLGRNATETAVKRMPLAEYRIVYFATHALVAGDIKGVAEPSLVLSIPSTPTEFDDGLLTASEVAQLKLNADWVVLSACNTIAGDRPGAEALSGLARSFFYAGAKALLVTHWAVDSSAATRLTTSTFEYLRLNPNLGRAEALRQAMLDYLNDPANTENAHPAIWGPFTLVGEGSSR